MTKIYVLESKYCDLDLGSLKDIKLEIENLIELYGEDSNVRFDVDQIDYSETYAVKMCVEVKRLETDREYNKRLKDQAKTKEIIENRKKKDEEKDRKTYEALKKKFEGKNGS